jgi:hypothetical protein
LIGTAKVYSDGKSANVKLNGDVGRVLDGALLLSQVFEMNTIDRVVATDKDGVRKDITKDILALRHSDDDGDEFREIDDIIRLD